MNFNNQNNNQNNNFNDSTGGFSGNHQHQHQQQQQQMHQQLLQQQQHQHQQLLHQQQLNQQHEMYGNQQKQLVNNNNNHNLHQHQQMNHQQNYQHHSNDMQQQQQQANNQATLQPTIVLPLHMQKKYSLIRELGQGAYGIVFSAKNNETGQDIAIKKVTKIFEKSILTKRALRELKLLKHFNGHENITAIFDIEVTDMNTFTELFLIQELMEADLHQIIRSGQPLTEAHHQYFIYQICRGIKYIHSANVLHRDLKPGNLLVNADCELKICDFGLARGFSTEPDVMPHGFLTEYVATRWYRAPEIMLSYRSYSKAIDIWSIGCIFAELIGGKPLFKGKDYVDQLNQILNVLGTPSHEVLTRIGSERAQQYVKSLAPTRMIPFQAIYPNANEKTIDLLAKLLTFDPDQRITVDECLNHTYLESYHEESDEPVHPLVFDFGFEAIQDTQHMRQMIANEIIDFKNSQPVIVERGASLHSQRPETVE